MSSSTEHDTPEFTSVNLNTDGFFPDAVDGMFAERDAMKKQGKVGAFIARHRTESIFVAGVLLIVGACTVSMWLMSGFYQTVAAGFTHEQVNAVRTSIEHSDVGSVLNVVEPLARMNTTFHVLIMYNYLATASTERFAALRTPSVATVTRTRYAEWPVSQSIGAQNFTFDALEARLASDMRKHSLPCACFAEYGVPLNAVMLSSNRVIYGAAVDHEACAKKVATASPLLSAMATARRYMAAMSSDASLLPTGGAAPSVTLEHCPSAIVAGTVQSGLQLRATVRDDEAQCALSCIKVFEGF